MRPCHRCSFVMFKEINAICAVAGIIHSSSSGSAFTLLSFLYSITQLTLSLFCPNLGGRVVELVVVVKQCEGASDQIALFMISSVKNLAHKSPTLALRLTRRETKEETVSKEISTPPNRKNQSFLEKKKLGLESSQEVKK